MKFVKNVMEMDLLDPIGLMTKILILPMYVMLVVVLVTLVNIIIVNDKKK